MSGEAGTDALQPAAGATVSRVFHQAPGPAGAQGTVVRGSRVRGLTRLLGVKELGIIVVLVVLIVLIGTVRPNFLTVGSLVNIGQRSAWYGILALGTVFLLSMGEIDLSIGALYGVCINAAAVLMAGGTDPWVAAAAGLLLGVGLGGLNGVVANVLRLPTIIITLGTLSMYRGLALIVSGGRSIYEVPRQHAFFQVFGGAPLGLPMAMWALLVLTGGLAFLYGLTRFGFVIRAIGSNPRAARVSGIPVARMRVLALLLMGGLCGVSAMLTLAFFGTADPNLGTGYELQAIAAAIIGGTALSGGRGTVIGALLGSLVIAVIASGVVQFGVSANYSIFVTGAMIVAAVAFDSIVRRRQAAT
jgi:ribose transport system permease protein